MTTIFLTILLIWIVIFMINLYLYKEENREIIEDIKWLVNEKFATKIILLILFIQGPYWLYKAIRFRFVIWSVKRTVNRIMRKDNPDYDINKELRELKEEKR